MIEVTNNYLDNNEFYKINIDKIRKKLKPNGLIMDIQNIFPSSKTDFCL